MEFLRDNYEPLSLIITFATLLVWLTYAQLLLRSYKRQLRPQLIIHQAQGYGRNSSLILSNLSAEPVHIECIMAVFHSGEERTIRQINALKHIEAGEPASEPSVARQGPLPTGASMPLGTVRELFDLMPDTTEYESGETNANPVKDAEVLEIRVVAKYGSEDMPVGARRKFRISHDGDTTTVWPIALQTERMSSRAQRRRVVSWLETCARHGYPRVRGG